MKDILVQLRCNTPKTRKKNSGLNSKKRNKKKPKTRQNVLCTFSSVKLTIKKVSCCFLQSRGLAHIFTGIKVEHCLHIHTIILAGAASSFSLMYALFLSNFFQCFTCLTRLYRPLKLQRPYIWS